MKVPSARKCAVSQRGFSLIAVLFLIVVVATLGGFAVRIGAGQQQTVGLGLLTARAAAAANSGLEWARSRADSGSCTPTNLFGVAQTGMNGFQVRVDCSTIAHGALTQYTLTSTATLGNYGTADYVSRQVQLRCITGQNC